MLSEQRAKINRRGDEAPYFCEAGALESQITPTDGSTGASWGRKAKRGTLSPRIPLSAVGWTTSLHS
jgi:hypothetical protein